MGSNRFIKVIGAVLQFLPGFMVPARLAWVPGLLMVLVTTATANAQGAYSDQRLEWMTSASRAFNEAKDNEAIDWYTKVAYAGDGTLIVDSLSGRALHGIGSSTRYVDTVLENATRFYHLANSVQRRIFERYHGEIARTYSSLSYTLQQKGVLDSAMYYADLSLEQFANIHQPDTLTWILTLAQVAVMTAEMEDVQVFRDASKSCHQLLTRYEENMPEEELLNTYQNLAMNAATLRQIDAATIYADKLLRLCKRYGNQKYVEDVYNAFNIIHYYQAEYEAAGMDLATAIELNGGGDPEKMYYYLFNQAELQLILQQPEKAINSAKESLTFKVPNRFAQADVENLIGIANTERGNVEEALVWFNAGIATIRPNSVVTRRGITYLDVTTLQSNEVVFYIDHLSERAKYFTRNGLLEFALEDIIEALEGYDITRGQVSNNLSRQFHSSTAREIYDDAVEVCLRLYRQTGRESYLWQAFQLSDRARAYTLLASLAEQSRILAPRELELSRRISRSEATATQTSTEERELAFARLELDRIRRRRRIDTTEIYQPTIQQLRHYCSSSGLSLIQYHLGYNAAYAFYLPPSGDLQVITLPGSEALTDRVTSFIEHLNSSAYRVKPLRPTVEQRRLEDSLRAAGSFLSKTLLPRNLPTEGNLLIIPDGALSYLPFTALPLSNSPAATFLSNTVNLRTAYSLSSLLAPGQTPNTGAANLTLAPSFTHRLQPLRHNMRELADITELVPNVAGITGDDATRLNFLKQAETAHIIHLSTHGESNAANPNRSWIAFSQHADTLVEDQLLFYPEISNLNLSADLVVLAACETNLGKYAPGETTLSLASAFTAAGARSTVTTLWKVDDQATAELMKLFYTGLAEGQPRSAALADAQRRIAATEDYHHPYYWSGFVLTGQDGPIEFPANRKAWPWLLGVAAGLLIGYGAWSYRPPALAT